ncbi:hydrogenase expression/formation protein HypE [bacterium]|nr:hydrogenase expression/formation protein HypE [bacterium]
MTDKDDERILLAHGSGGAMMHNLIRDVFLRHLDSPELAALDDAAELTIDSVRIAFSTDTFVVKPIFFPGGDIGSLAVCGTVNDVLMKGARPLYLSLGFVIEEGFFLKDLERIVHSIGQTSIEAGVSVVTGDTKVVGSGEMDGICINTAGIGVISAGISVSGSNAHAGDSILVSGTIGEHGIAVLAERNGLSLRGAVRSDAAPLTGTVLPFLDRFGASIHVLRDPTRGGLAATLNEIAGSSGVGIVVQESVVPVSDPVSAVCGLLGFDPLYLPCEGRFLAIVDDAVASDAVTFLRTMGNCPDAAMIGMVADSPHGEVILSTASGGRRILDMPVGELLPRIC